MARPIGVGARAGAGSVDIVFRPPLEFILRQSAAFRHQLEDLDGLWDRFEPLMSDLEAQQWDSHGFGEWPPLADSTLRQKTSGELMVETGALRDSLVDPASAAKRSARQLEWSTDVPYAGFHQEGGDDLPQREVIPDPFPVDWRRRFERETVSYVNDAARKTWGAV